MQAFIQRHGQVIRWGATAVILGSALLLVRALPLEELTARLTDWVEGLGLWGPVAFVGAYVLATVLLVPGSLLTLAAGAVFGLGPGFAVVSAGSTLGAALAFLIARYLARSRVEALAAEHPKFAAIDDAIREGGWKVVGLLRLSPAIPFNLQNYLYGLTDLKFWPYVLTSWLAMMPGTLMYVYLGYAARTATGGEQSIGKWALLGVGLLATVAVTVYVTRLARQRLQEKTTVAEPPVSDKPPESIRKVIGFMLAAALLLMLAIWVQFTPG